MRNVADLSLDPRNARKHAKRSIEEIKSSLVQFGQQKPIVVDKSGKVIAGNGTLTAASELGWTELWAETTTLDAKAAKAYAIVDNRSAEFSAWDRDVLSSSIRELGVDGFDTSSMGWSKSQLEAMSPEGGVDIIKESWCVLVTCKDEKEQGALLSRLTAEGLDVRSVIS